MPSYLLLSFRQGNLKPVVHTQMAFEHPQGTRLHSVSGRPAQPSSQFTEVQVSSFVFSFLPLDSYSVSGLHWEEPAPSFQIFIYTDKITPKPFLFQATHLQLSQPLLIGEILQFFYHICGPTLNSFQCDHVSCTGEPITAYSTPGMAPPVLTR